MNKASGEGKLGMIIIVSTSRLGLHHSEFPETVRKIDPLAKTETIIRVHHTDLNNIISIVESFDLPFRTQKESLTILNPRDSEILFLFAMLLFFALY